MKILETIGKYAGKYMALWTLLITVIGLAFPKPVSLVFKTSYINWLLMVVMFGMGLTLSFQDFKVVFVRPKEVFVGLLAQFLIMPFFAWLLTLIFHLPPELAVGVILVGTCPGGTASNVITYLAGGDVALSVGMTACSTLFSPFLTPLLTKFYAGAVVNVPLVPMFFSITQIVVIPVVLGLLINRFFGNITKKAVKVLPLVSILAILSTMISIISANAERLLGALSQSGIVVLVIILHNLSGLFFGFWFARLFKIDSKKSRTVAIEVGMQNSGLATALASSLYKNLALATVPGVIFSIIHNLSGTLLASFWHRKDQEKI